ncbi:MAG: HAD family hydrolase [Chloroflexota bacterium]
MITQKFDAVIFDMDGLLVDTERVWYEAEEAFLESFGHVYTAEAREAIVGLRMDEFLAKLKVIYSLEPTVETLSAMLMDRVMTLLETEVRAQPGAHEIIRYVRDAGLPYAIASSSPMGVINATLASQGWGDFFKIRCSADDDLNGKPAPDVYLRAAETLGVDPQKCLALEDSPNGARAAVAAGMTCYAVPDLTHTRRDAFTDITPNVFDSLHDVLEVLKT